VLEGDTEQIFYPLIRDKFLKGTRIEPRNIKGRGNVNKDVLSEIYKYIYVNRNDLVRAYCCVDTERNKHTATPLDLELICEKIKERGMHQVLSVDKILADPDIESWFFYDIDGIYNFLRVRKSQRSPKKYAYPKNLCKKDLQRLFDRIGGGKTYLPGKRAENFINHLDITKIVSECGELREGIELIKSQANDLTRHLFPQENSG
jgi:hypothetical protein